MSDEDERKPRPSSLPPVERTKRLDESTHSQRSLPATPSDGYFTRLKDDELATYQRDELDNYIKDAFRDRQKQRKERQVEHLVLGKGLGPAAEQSLKKGLYQPTKVLEPISESEARMWDSLNLAKAKTTLESLAEEEEDADAPKYASSMIRVDDRGRLGGNFQGGIRRTIHEDGTITQEPIPSNPQFTDKLRQTLEPVSMLSEVRREVEDNVSTAERELDAKCAPFTFKEVQETLVNILIVLERGDLSEPVALPMYTTEPPSFDVRERAEQRKREQDNPSFLIGAENTLQFLREKVLPVAYEVLPITHATQWVGQYTISFLRALVTANEAEAQLRVELLARCVRLLGQTESFSAVLLSLESKCEEYDAFIMLRESAESHLSSLLDTVEEALDSVKKCSFPHRRAHLVLIERGIKAKLQRALLFTNELDYNWTPNVKFHILWKEKFLSEMFRRIYTNIAPMFVYCALGFIDECIYEKVKDSRITGKTHGATANQPSVIRARQVEYDKVVNNLNFQQIGMSVKRTASNVVGLQLCMGARYVLKQCTEAYDVQWGFPMHENVDGPSDETVSKAMNTITKHAKQKSNPPAKKKTKKSAFFLTQDGDDEVEEA